MGQLESGADAVIRFSALGDLAAALPVLRAFRRKPVIVTSTLGHAFLKDEFDDFLVLPDKRVRSMLRLAWEMRRRHFHQVVDLQNNDRSRILRRLSGAKVFDNRQISLNKPATDIFRGIAAPSGLLGEIDMIFEPRSSDYIVLNCGSSAKWACKRLPVERWQYIARQLLERFGVRFVLTGDASEREYVQALASQLEGQTEVLAGKTSLGELKQVLSGALLTVSTDSAAMHISAVQKTPTIGLFGPTSWIRSAPWGPWSIAVYDQVYYPNGTPPARNVPVEGRYFDHIDISDALEKLAPYLPR